MGDLAFKLVLPSLYDQVKAKLYVDGEEKATLSTGDSASVIQGDVPMPIATYRTVDANYYLKNSDVLHMNAGVSEKHTCAIVYDFSEYEYDSITIRNPTNEPSITITANQSN